MDRQRTPGFSIEEPDWAGTIMVPSITYIRLCQPCMGLRDFCQYLSNRFSNSKWSESPYRSVELTAALAKSMALNTQRSGAHSPYTVYPIPAGEIDYEHDWLRRPIFVPDAQPPRVNEWTLMLHLKDTPDNNVEYAFIGRDASSKTK